MAQVTLGGNAVHTVGELPKVGSVAPDFIVVYGDLSEGKLSDFRGKRVVINIFPSIDTDVCAKSVRTFNMRASCLLYTSGLPASSYTCLCTKNELGAYPSECIWMLLPVPPVMPPVGTPR